MFVLVQLWISETGISPGERPSNILWSGMKTHIELTHTHAHVHNSRQAEKCIKGDFIEIKDLVPTKCSNAKAFKVHFRMVLSFVVDI